MPKRPPIAEEATVQTEPDRDGKVVEVWIYPRRVRCWPPPDAAANDYPPGVYRIAYYDENGKRRGGTSPTAVDADERCQRLSNAAARGAFKSLRPFGTYLDEWEAEHLGEQAHRNREATLTSLRYLREHGPVTVACGELTPGSFSPLFRVAAKTRNDGGLDQLRRSINTILGWGGPERWFTDVPTIAKKSLPSSKKAAGGRARIREAGEDEGTLRRDDVASHAAVRELADAMAEHYGVWWAALAVYLGAYGGVRYGELMALTSQRLIVPGHASFDEHPHTLRVWWQVTELGKNH